MEVGWDVPAVAFGAEMVVGEWGCVLRVVECLERGWGGIGEGVLVEGQAVGALGLGMVALA